MTEWTPAVTRWAGSVRLSHGSSIVSVLQSRQRELVGQTPRCTRCSIWVLRLSGVHSFLVITYPSLALTRRLWRLALPTGWVWISSINTTVQLRLCVATCIRFIYSDVISRDSAKSLPSTNEGFNEVWFFYCSSDSFTFDAMWCALRDVSGITARWRISGWIQAYGNTHLRLLRQQYCRS